MALREVYGRSQEHGQDVEAERYHPSEKSLASRYREVLKIQMSPEVQVKGGEVLPGGLEE